MLIKSNEMLVYMLEKKIVEPKKLDGSTYFYVEILHRKTFITSSFYVEILHRKPFTTLSWHIFLERYAGLLQCLLQRLDDDSNEVNSFIYMSSLP